MIVIDGNILQLLITPVWTGNIRRTISMKADKEKLSLDERGGWSR